MSTPNGSSPANVSGYVVTKYQPVPIDPQLPQVKEQLWGKEVTLAETPEYSLKVLYYKAGHAGGLQAHATKDESFTLHRGEAWVDSDDGKGNLIHTLMVGGQTFHIPSGAVHRFRAITDCVVYEASTNVKDDRIRLEHWYGEPEVPGLPSTHPEPVRDR